MCPGDPRPAAELALGDRKPLTPRTGPFGGISVPPARVRQEQAPAMGSDLGILPWVHGHHQSQVPKAQWAQVLRASTPHPSSQCRGVGLKQLLGNSLHPHHVHRGQSLLLLTKGADAGAGLDPQVLDIGPPALLHPDYLPSTVQGHAGRCPKPGKSG